MKAIALAITLGAMTLSGCAVTGGSTPSLATKAAEHPEARPYDPSINAKAAVAATSVQAAVLNKTMMVVMGANWCHDSRAFAGWLETPRFQKLIDEHYAVAFVNVGMPQTGDGHNLDIARQYGIEKFEGTPTVLIVSREGTVLNAATAKTWRNAASRSEDDIYNELASYVIEDDI